MEIFLVTIVVLSGLIMAMLATFSRSEMGDFITLLLKSSCRLLERNAKDQTNYSVPYDTVVLNMQSEISSSI